MPTLADIVRPMLRGTALLGRGACLALHRPRWVLPIAIVTGAAVIALVLYPLVTLVTLLGLLYALGLPGDPGSGVHPDASSGSGRLP